MNSLFRLVNVPESARLRLLRHLWSNLSRLIKNRNGIRFSFFFYGTETCKMGT